MNTFNSSPWNINKSIDSNSLQQQRHLQQSQEQRQEQESNNYLPSLFLDALGGGKKSNVLKTSSPLKPILDSIHSNMDDDLPPSQSLFNMNPVDMKTDSIYSLPNSRNQMYSFPSTPVALNHPRLTSPIDSSLINASPAASASASRNYSGSPMDLDVRESPARSSIYSPSVLQSHSATPLKSQTTVTIIGFPPNKWRTVLEMAKTIDNIISFRKSDGENGNWMVITFASIKGVLKIKESDGKLFEGSWLFTVKMGDTIAQTSLQTAQITNLDTNFVNSETHPSSSYIPHSKPKLNTKLALDINQKDKIESIPKPKLNSLDESQTKSNLFSWVEEKQVYQNIPHTSLKPSLWYKVYDVLFCW